jgi:hypothetical protein
MVHVTGAGSAVVPHHEHATAVRSSSPTDFSVAETQWPRGRHAVTLVR